MLGGVIDLSNILPYGAFWVCESWGLQEELHEELKSIWEHADDPIPSYARLAKLPLLVRGVCPAPSLIDSRQDSSPTRRFWLIARQTGVVKESQRLTHGVISGPPRVVPATGAQIDGYDVPPMVWSSQAAMLSCRTDAHIASQTVVTTSSLYCHMNSEVFPEPEKFKPERWHSSTTEMEKSLVPFSKGRRMCPAKESATLRTFHSLVESCLQPKLTKNYLFAGYHSWSYSLSSRPSSEGSSYKYSIPRKSHSHSRGKSFGLLTTTQTMCRREDFEWKVYLSLHFKGRFFHALLKPRPGFSGSGGSSMDAGHARWKGQVGDEYRE